MGRFRDSKFPRGKRSRRLTSGGTSKTGGIIGDLDAGSRTEDLDTGGRTGDLDTGGRTGDLDTGGTRAVLAGMEPKLRADSMFSTSSPLQGLMRLLAGDGSVDLDQDEDGVISSSRRREFSGTETREFLLRKEILLLSG